MLRTQGPIEGLARRYAGSRPIHGHRKVARDHTFLLPLLLFFFFTFGSVYPWLRITIVDSINIPSWISGLWVDLVSFAILLLSAKGTFARAAPSRSSMAFYCFIILSGGLSAFPFDRIDLALFGLRQTYEPMIFFMAGLWVGAQRHRIQMVGRIFVIVAAISAAIGLYFLYIVPDYWTGLFQTDANNARGWGLDSIARESGLRMTGAFLDPVVFGAVTAWGAVIAFASQFLPDFRRSLSAPLALALCVTAAVLSLSRGAWIVLIIGWSVSLMMNTKWLRTWRMAATLGVLVAGTIVAAKSDMIGSTSEILSRTVDKTLVEGNSQREGQFEGGLNRFLARPFGVGLGKEGHVGERYSGSGMSEDGHEFVTDGWYLKVLSEGGIFLFVSFIGFIVSIFNKSFLNVTSSKDVHVRIYSTVILSLLVSVIIQATVSNIWDLYFTAQCLWLICGIGCAIPLNSENKRI
jgi:ABC-type multidrug transport system fused ATPase/permease subunit